MKNFLSPCVMKRLVLVLVCLVCVKCSSRDKRQLIFPPQSIMQLAFGVVTPAQVQNRQIATNMGIMFNIDLPTNVSVWYPWRTDYKRKRSADTDQAFYSLLQTALSMNGLDGKACVQKSVCQIKENPIERDDNIMAKILNVVFGYSQRHIQDLWKPQHHNISCDLAYPTCQYSAIDLLFHLVNSDWISSQ